MRREIKFRAYDKEDRKMYPISGFSYLPLDGTGTCRIYFLIGSNEVLLKDYSEKIAVMQYTGLKDKNGKEIYEGDILNLEENLADSWIRNHIVKFEGGCFYPFGTGDWEESSSSYEIIGNIYETPELLEKK